jgi:hypothetical protein
MSMRPEVQELYDALTTPGTLYYDASAVYERLRARLISKLGYDVFRALQREAFKEIKE